MSASEPRPTIYLVETADWGGDVAGSACLPDRVLWGHISSNWGFLRRDLTDGFGDRRAELAAMFPGGYEVVEVPLGSPIPDAIAGLFTTEPVR